METLVNASVLFPPSVTLCWSEAVRSKVTVAQSVADADVTIEPLIVGLTSVGLVLNTLFQVPVLAVAHVPPFATAIVSPTKTTSPSVTAVFNCAFVVVTVLDHRLIDLLVRVDVTLS